MTREEISRELNLMRDAGLGGVELQPVYPVEVDDPQRRIRNIRYFSEEWFTLLRHTAQESARLGLQFDFTLGSGWPYGGPFVPLDLAARRLRVTRQEIEGPRHCSFEFLSGEIAEGDKVICAVAAPVLASGELDLAHSKVLARGGQTEAVAFRSPGWQVPPGRWCLMLFINSPTRQQVKRPTLGMEGYVLDHFNRRALELFLDAVGNRTLSELESVNSNPIHSIFCDSLEVYGADWTGAVLEEFARRRGYDVAPYLPALWQEAGPLTAHVRYDYHLTLSDLIIENFFQPLAAWSEAHHVKARVQAHGTMSDVMRAYSLAHIPEGESIFGGDRYGVDLKHRRLASSAGHIYAKPVISAETYTWLRQPLFLETLEMMKAATDAMFLDGINQIVNHGYPSSPPEAGVPGWTFYASTVINHNNTWWRHYPYLARYILRAAALLREGVAVNPVAVYLPLADVYAKYGCGGLAMDEVLENHMGLELFLALRRAGYDFDLLNDHALNQVARVEDGKLRAGTAQYSIIIVPECKLMPPESLARLAEFARAGGTLIFVGGVPEMAPGMTGQPARTAQLKATLAELLGSRPTPEKGPRRYGSGEIVLAPNRSQALKQLQAFLPPDFTIVSAGKDELQGARENVGFVHRRFRELDHYFVSNVSSEGRNLRIRFACGHKAPQRWNPETGDVQETLAFAYVGTAKQEATEVTLSLEPFESCFLVFSPASQQPIFIDTDFRRALQVEPTATGIRVHTELSENHDYFLTRPDGSVRRFAVHDLPDPAMIPGPWKVRLGAREIETARLQSWTEFPEGKGYSGWAVYETAFGMEQLPEGIRWVLDLGSVHETAEAELNGTALGAAWKGSRTLSTKSALKLGPNRLIIRVANLWIQHVLSVPPRDVSRVVATYGARWGEPEIAVPRSVPPSGLLGPVRLIPVKSFTVTLDK